MSWIIRFVVSGILFGLHMTGLEAYADDERRTISQFDGSSISINSPQNYIWDFYVPSSIRAGKTAEIDIEAWSEEGGSTSSYLKFYLSKDGELDIKKDKLIGRMKIDFTAPIDGQNKFFSGTFKIPAKTRAGNYFFFLTIDGRETTLRGNYFSQRLKIKKG